MAFGITFIRLDSWFIMKSFTFPRDNRTTFILPSQCSCSKYFVTASAIWLKKFTRSTTEYRFFNTMETKFCDSLIPFCIPPKRMFKRHFGWKTFTTYCLNYVGNILETPWKRLMTYVSRSPEKESRDWWKMRYYRTQSLVKGGSCAVRY